MPKKQYTATGKLTEESVPCTLDLMIQEAEAAVDRAPLGYERYYDGFLDGLLAFKAAVTSFSEGSA